MTIADNDKKQRGINGGTWTLTSPRVVKLLVDAAILVGATILAFLIRFDLTLPDATALFIAIGVFLPLKALGYVLLGLQRRSWSNLTFRDIGGIMGLGAFSAVTGTLVLMLFGDAMGVPRSIAVLD